LKGSRRNHEKIVEEFVRKVIGAVEVVSQIPPEAGGKIGDKQFKTKVLEETAMLRVLEETEKAIFEIKRTIRIVNHRYGKNIIAIELPEKAELEITAKTYGSTFKISGNAIPSFPISSIIEYLNPKNTYAEKIIEEIIDLKCETCYIEEKDYFKHYTFEPYRLLKIEEAIKNAENKVKNKPVDIIYLKLVYPIVERNRVISYKTDEVAITRLAETRIYAPTVIEEDVLKRITEMFDTLVKGAIVIVERFL